uniref:Glucosylceramidase n=1 Tax=Acrobeloides nanus TaxID=290746 RepID=A0A914E957_9BILA
MEFVGILLFLYWLNYGSTQKPCIPRSVNGDTSRIVCVCNSTYCDEFPPLGTLNPYDVAVYTSSISGKRFERTTATFTDIPPFGLGSLLRSLTQLKVKLDDSNQYQKMAGFGCSLGESPAYHLFQSKLSNESKTSLLHAFFGQEGIGYSIGRVPIFTCDHPEYGCIQDNVTDDFNLTHFSLVGCDLQLKIPLIKNVQQLVGNELKLFTSPWSAPGWMKTNGQITGSDNIKGEVNGPYWQAWANYHIRFFEEYAKQGINFWGMTVQNEGSSTGLVGVDWAAMWMGPEMTRDFIKETLGPALRNHPLTKDIFLMINDDQKWLLPWFTYIVLSDPDAAKFINGTAVHWYENFLANPALTLGLTHAQFPNHALFASEASNDYLDNSNHLGLWSDAIAYASDIIDDFQHWVTGWTDWNSWLIDFSYPPIVINRTIDEFYKNPVYYALGHFSKFVRPNSIRVNLGITGIQGISFHSADLLKDDVDGIGFLTSSNQHVVVLQNRDNNNPYQLSIQDAGISGKEVKLTIEPNSFVTLVWNKI